MNFAWSTKFRFYFLEQKKTGEMHDVEYNVAQMKEFRNLKEFAVVYQPWTVGLNVSKKKSFVLIELE